MFSKKIIFYLSALMIVLTSCISTLIAMDAELDILRTYSSKNFRSRADKTPEILVLHCVGLDDKWVFDNYCVPPSEGGMDASAHYYISADAKTYQLVPEDQSAYHAGVSDWRDHAKRLGLKGLNDVSIGIELQSLGYAQLPKEGYFPLRFTSFSPEQMERGILLSQRIMRKHQIPPENVVWHSDISFRKTDPGPQFSAQEWAKKGVGVWPSTTRLEDTPLDTSLTNIQGLLKAWGYPLTTTSGAFDEETKKALQAHCLHYLPGSIHWKTYEEQSSGTVFDSITEWENFPIDKDTLCISLENLVKGHYVARD